MPVTGTEEIVNASAVPEFRKIKIGEKGANAPKKWTAPAVTMPNKADAGSKFSVDEEIMAAIRKSQGKFDKDGKVDKSAPIDGVPVYLMSDSVDEIVYTYRAMYNSRGRAMCKSNLGDTKAKRFFTKEEQPESKATKVGNLFILNNPIDIECTPSCEFWLPYGTKERAKCQWHAIVATQLVHAPRFPNPTRYRTSGPMVIKAMRASLKKIAAVTNGVLANIPLTLTEVEIETVNGSGDKRRHPVMIFVFQGTLGDLREAAIAELQSRARLQAAKEGKPVGTALPLADTSFAGKMTAGDLPPMTGEDVSADAVTDDPDDFVDFDDEKVERTPPPAGAATATPAEADAHKKLHEEVQALKTKAGVSDRGLQALEDKHGGDMAKVRDELAKLSAGPAAKTETKTETKAAATVTPAVANASASAFDDDFDLGEESEEKSDVEDREREQKEAEAKEAKERAEKAELEKAAKAAEQANQTKAAAKPAVTTSTFDDFDVFDQ